MSDRYKKRIVLGNLFIIMSNQQYQGQLPPQYGFQGAQHPIHMQPQPGTVYVGPRKWKLHFIGLWIFNILLWFLQPKWDLVHHISSVLPVTPRYWPGWTMRQRPKRTSPRWFSAVSCELERVINWNKCNILLIYFSVAGPVLGCLTWWTRARMAIITAQPATPTLERIKINWGITN